jgi:ribose transport system substrate-binding protein
MLKRFSLFACAGAIALGMIGCGGGENAGGATDNGKTPETKTAGNGKKLRIGVSLPAADHGWTGGALYWATEATKKYPDIEWTIEAAKDPSEQINQLDTLATKGIDALVILATESAPVTPKAKELHDRGIFIVNVDRGFTDPSIADVFIAGDNKAFGQMSADYIVKKLNGKGNILVVRGIPCTVDTDRYDTAMAEFKKHADIHVLDSQPGMWNKDTSYKVMQSMLLKNPKVDAIWSSDDDMSEGVEQALKEASRDKGIWLLGGGGKKEIVKRIMDKDAMYPATVTYPPDMTGQAVDECVKIMKSGKKPEKQESIIVKLDVVTPENAKGFYHPDSVY